MFFHKQKNKIIEYNNRWYIESPAGFEGPFDSRCEAQRYLSSGNQVGVKKVEFTELEDSLYKT